MKKINRLNTQLFKITLLFIFCSNSFLYGQDEIWYDSFESNGKYGIVSKLEDSHSVIDTIIPASHNYIEKVWGYTGGGFLIIDEKIDFSHFKGVTFLDSNLKQVNYFDEIYEVDFKSSILRNGDNLQIFNFSINKPIYENLDSALILSICLLTKDSYFMGVPSECKSTETYFYIVKNGQHTIYTNEGSVLVGPKNVPIKWNKKWSLFQSNSDYYSITGEKFSTDTKSISGRIDHSKISSYGRIQSDYLKVISNNGEWDLWSSEVRKIKNNEIFYSFDKTLILANIPKDYVFSNEQYSESKLVFETPSGLVLIEKDGNWKGEIIFEEILPFSEVEGALIIGKIDGKFTAFHLNGEIVTDFNWDNVICLNIKNALDNYYIVKKMESNFLLDREGKKVVDYPIREVSFRDQGYTSYLIIEDTNGQFSFQDIDGSFSKLGDKNRLREYSTIYETSKTEYLLQYKSIIELKEYEEDVLTYYEKHNGESIEFTHYYQDEKMKEHGYKIKFQDTESLYSEMNHYLPIGKHLKFNKKADTISIYTYPDTPEIEVYNRYGEIFPLQLIDLTYDSESNNLIKREVRERINHQDNFDEEPYFIGWQYYYYGTGEKKREVYYDFKKGKHQNLYAENTGHQNTLTMPIIQRSYSSEGKLSHKKTIDKNNIYEVRYFENGKIEFEGNSSLSYFNNNEEFENWTQYNENGTIESASLDNKR
ncbi:hypothetical protein ERX46_17355 [Brumimicrobium glaciale]|uniref:WG repeat-containing protein n=1 Tax=Brumimicrobium glaciale TaxID=200475 RepID=A0A4Q4KGL7_9FLAO|nr:hypothetical protein [Brumimicrobium glaciale]RYM30849.1 hypothetical protein ERX46_17355 [Brumimicrobium glaciale]